MSTNQARRRLLAVILGSAAFPNVFAFLPATRLMPHQAPSVIATKTTTTTLFTPRIMTSLAAFYDLSAVEALDPTSLWTAADSVTQALTISPDRAEALAGPFFGASLFPYLAFLYFLSRPKVNCPKGVTVGFATCLLFVFLTIPAAIAAKLIYGVSLADSDWLHGSAESLLTLTNLVTVVAFRQALQGLERPDQPPPESATSYKPMMVLVGVGTLLACITALVPAVAADTAVHTPYLGGFLDLPATAADWVTRQPEPVNALSIPCWIIHVSSLVEFLVAMGFCWRWADVKGVPQWKGLTWGLLPLHSSGITACTYHFFYNQIPILIPLQAFLTLVGNTTAAYAAFRIARAEGWSSADFTFLPEAWRIEPGLDDDDDQVTTIPKEVSQPGLVGFEDLGDALVADNDYSFLVKLFAGCAVGSYVLKYGETWVDFPLDANVYAGLAFILVPSLLNAYKWSQRSNDPSFKGWF
jgi:hypothetical protein